MIYFTSDSHFDHANIIKLSNRPFVDINDMHSALIDNWNSTVKKNDIIYHLGDFSLNKKTHQKILTSLNGRKILIKGNHDKKPTLDDGWNEIYDILEIKFKEQLIILCHFPLLVWNKSHYKSWHLHGHCHGSLPDDSYSLRIDVGVDCHDYFPISFDRVEELMKNKSFIPKDHHRLENDYA